MACSPSLTHHYINYHHHHHPISSSGGGHVSCSLSSSDRSRAHLSNFSGLNIIGSDLNCRYRKMSVICRRSTTTKDTSNFKHAPDHLLVLVHGILASPSDWTYADTELKRQLGCNFLIYASSSNSYTKTFNGIDGAGRCLADEVLSMVERTGNLKRISFLAHSLGGLFARYAIVILYSRDTGAIAGLDPINFITLATPYLGVRGKKQEIITAQRML